MDTKIEPQEHAREFTRWMILRMLYAIRPGGVSETVLMHVLGSLDFNCELDDVRREVDYLRSLGLAEAGKGSLTGRSTRLTELGAAVVEYSAHAPAGIDRPRRRRSSKR